MTLVPHTGTDPNELGLVVSSGRGNTMTKNEVHLALFDNATGHHIQGWFPIDDVRQALDGAERRTVRVVEPATDPASPKETK